MLFYRIFVSDTGCLVPCVGPLFDTDIRPFNNPLGLAGAWEALFVYDSIIFGMTLYKTWLARRDHGVTGVDVPLIALILRDGKSSSMMTFVIRLTCLIGAIYFACDI